jgi:hypothetical protein
MSLLDRFRRTFSQMEDSDGPINTDRPTFTPAKNVAPRGRLQFESGWTFNGDGTSRTRDYVYDFHELAVRYGLMDRVELRMFWLGQISPRSRREEEARGDRSTARATWKSGSSGSYSRATRSGNGSPRRR